MSVVWSVLDGRGGLAQIGLAICTCLLVHFLGVLFPENNELGFYLFNGFYFVNHYIREEDIVRHLLRELRLPGDYIHAFLIYRLLPVVFD